MLSENFNYHNHKRDSPSHQQLQANPMGLIYFCVEMLKRDQNVSIKRHQDHTQHGNRYIAIKYKRENSTHCNPENPFFVQVARSSQWHRKHAEKQITECQ